MIFTDEQVDKAYAAAPEHTREFLVEGDFVSLISSFATREGFSGEKRSELISVLRNFAIGLETEESVQEALVGSGIDAPRASTLMQTIVQSIVPSDKRAPRFSESLPHVSSPITPASAKPNLPTATVTIPTAGHKNDIAKSAEVGVIDNANGETIVSTQGSVQMPKTTAPTLYTTDPYREPVE